MSRGPGAAVHELGIGALDRVGGSVLVNLASVAFAALALWSVHALVHRDRGRWPACRVLVLGANPWFWIAATSLGDFVWALGLLLAGAVAAQARSPCSWRACCSAWPSGAGRRPLLLVVAWLLAEGLGDDGRPRPRWRAVAGHRSGGAGGGRRCASSRRGWTPAASLDFLDNELQFVGFARRTSVAGPSRTWRCSACSPGVVLLVRHPQLRWRPCAAGGRRRSSGSRSSRSSRARSLFLRFPFKPIHLLPVVAGTGAARSGRRRCVTQRWVDALVVGAAGRRRGGRDLRRARRARTPLARVGSPVSVTAGPAADRRAAAASTTASAAPGPTRRRRGRDPAGGRNAACQNATWQAATDTRMGDGRRAIRAATFRIVALRAVTRAARRWPRRWSSRPAPATTAPGGETTSPPTRHDDHRHDGRPSARPAPPRPPSTPPPSRARSRPPTSAAGTSTPTPSTTSSSTNKPSPRSTRASISTTDATRSRRASTSGRAALVRVDHDYDDRQSWVRTTAADRRQLS